MSDITNHEYKIRKATLKDMAAINEIVNYYIKHTDVNLDIEERPLSYHEQWFLTHKKEHPILVADCKGEVIAYASLSRLYEKGGFDIAAEISIYVKHPYCGLGIGKKLMEQIFDIAREDKKITTIISKITSGNDASDALHKRYGFKKIGTYRNIAIKFGKYVDVDIYQIHL